MVEPSCQGGGLKQALFSIGNVWPFYRRSGKTKIWSTQRVWTDEAVEQAAVTM